MFPLITKFFLLALYCNRCSASLNNQPLFHLAPERGWMNDPNGFCSYNYEYHMFYQYNPETSQDPGIAHWGHARSLDLLRWEHLPIAMYPDQPYDKDGVFSGGAVVENDTMYIFYTGNINKPGEDPDHEQRQALAISYDGVNFTKYKGNPIIEAEELQPDIRDPKVWKHGNTFYMVLGNSFNNGSLGRALLYSSNNLINWKQVSVLDESDGSLGYMWECPDFFELGGKFVLLFSPQGIERQGDKFPNLYQVGYIIGTFDYETHKFSALTEFRELDHGHDFYATQTILDKSGHRIMMAWFDMWENIYPERDYGWTGQMTVARTLTLSQDNILIQKPIQSLYAARGSKLYCGKASPGSYIELKNKTGEIRIKAKLQDFEIIIKSENVSVSVSYDVKRGEVTLDRGGEDGIRRTKWVPEGKLLYWQILIDTTSIELFCGEGEVTFSSRYFPTGNVYVSLGNNSRAINLTVYDILRTVFY